MHARCHAGWSTPAGARTAAIAGAFRRSHRRAVRWPAPAEPRAESGTAARTAGSRGGRPGPATTEVDRHARRYARRGGQAAGGRTDEQVSARHEAASRADQAAGARRSAWTAAGQHSALDGAASRRGRCAPWPATGCATVGMAGKTPRACGQLRARGLWRAAPRDCARGTLHAPSGAGRHSAGRSCIPDHTVRGTQTADSCATRRGGHG